MLLCANAALAQQKSVTVNVLTGVAISGYDPVSYFTEAEPLSGSPEFEYVWSGVPWHFASAANRDVFMRNPDVYAPLFGGHCATSMARGFLSQGNPTIYRLVGNRLLLFYSVGNREAFDLSAGTTLDQAIVNWNALPEIPDPGITVPAAASGRP